MIALLSLALAAEPVMERRLPPIAVDYPFVATYLSVRQGAGLLTIHDYRVPGVGQFDLALAGATETLQAQAAVSERIAVEGRLGGRVVSGVNLDSAFVSGVQSGLSVELAGRAELLHRARSVVSLRVGFLGERGAGLSPAPLADAFASDRWDTVSAVLGGDVLQYVLGRRRVSAGMVTLSSGFDLGRGWGLLASATARVGTVAYLGFRKREIDRTSRTYGSGGLAVDWKPDGKVPLGTQFELHDRQESEGLLAGDERATSRNRLLGAATLAYTGRDELHLGLTLGVLVPSLKPSQEQLLTVEAAFRYDF